MTEAALTLAQLTFGVWLLTAFIGFYMFAVTLRLGNAESDAVDTHWPSWVALSHPTFALTGLAVWMAYLARGTQIWAWVALVILLLSGAVGGLMFSRWAGDARRTRQQVGRESPSADVGPQTRNVRLERGVLQTTVSRSLVEQQINPVAVYAHGLLAGLTTLLVLLCALNVAG